MTALYHASDSGKAFQAALLEEGYTLAQGKKIVLIDRDGTLHSLSRQVDGVKAKDIRAKLADVALPDVDEARGRQGRQGVGDRKIEAEQKPAAVRPVTPEPEPEEPAPAIVDRDQQDREWQEALIDAALAHRPTQATETGNRSPSAERINALQDRHHAELGRLYAENQQARDKLSDELGQQYGAQERTLRTDIARLEQAQKSAGPMRRFWSKVPGREAREAEELEGMRRSLAKIEWRKGEAHQTLENRISQQQETIKARQATERLTFEPRPAEELQHADGPVSDLLLHERQAIERIEIKQGQERKGPSVEF